VALDGQNSSELLFPSPSAVVPNSDKLPMVHGLLISSFFKDVDMNTFSFVFELRCFAIASELLYAGLALYLKNQYLWNARRHCRWRQINWHPGDILLAE
jgi:hypothetical protein